jgi:hypothetical protein
MLCIPLKFYQYLGKICRLHLDGQRISEGRNQTEAGNKHLLGLFYDPEDIGDMVRRNVS